jgi:phosphomannomutase
MYNVVMQDGTMRQKLIEDPDVPNELRELAKKEKVPFNTAHYLVNLSRWQKELEEAGGIEKALERVPVAQDKKILKHPVTQEDLYLMKLERRVQDLLDPGTQVTLPSTYTSEAKGASDLYGESYLHVLRKSLADLCPSRGCSQRMLPENFRDKYVKAGLDFDNFQSQLTESYIVLLRLLLGSEKVKKKTIVLNLTNENVLALKSKGRRKINTMYLIIPYIKKMFLQSRNVGHDFDFVIQLPKTFSQEEVDAFRGFYIGLLKSHGLDSAKWNLILTTDHEQVIKDGSHYVFNAEDFSLSNVYDRLKDTVSRELTLAYSSYKTLEEDVQSIGATEVILKKAFAITTDPVLVRSDTQVPRYATVDDVRAKYLFGTSGYRAHLSRRGLFKVLLPKLLLLLTSAEKELFQIFYLSKDFSDEERRVVEKYFALGHGKMFPYEREAFFTAWTRVSPETKLVLEKVLKNPGTLKDHINIAIENVFYENRRANVGNDALKLLALSSYTDELKEYMQDTVNYGAKEGLNHHGAVLMGQAMARMALKQDVPQIVIGYDTRIESQDYAEEIARAVVAESNGTVTPVIVDGYAATPILSWLMKTKYPKALGVILTPSHNPTEDIGEKPYGKRGIAFVDAQTTELSKTIEEMHTKIAMSAYYYTAPETVLDNEKYVIRLKTRDIVPEYMISLLRNLKASGLLKGDATLAGLAEAFKMQGRSIGVDGKFGMAAGFWPWLKKELKKEGFDRLHTYNMTPGANDFRNFDFGELEPHGDSLVGLDRDDNAIVVGNDPDADRTAVVVKKGRGWEVVDMNTLAAVLTYKKIKTILAEAPLGDGKKGRIVVATTVASSPLAVKVLLHFKEDLEGKGYTIVGINSFPVGYKYFFNTPQTQQTTKGENLFETKGPHDYVLTFEGSGGILAGQGNKDGDQGRDFSHDKDGFFGTLAAILVGDFTEKLEALKKELKIEALFKEKSFPVPPIVGSKHDTYSERKAKLYGYFAKLADEKSGERVNFTRAVKSIIGVEARTVVTVDGLKVFFLGESLRGSFLIRFSGTEEKMRIYAYLEKDVNEEGQHKEVKSELEKNMEEHLLRRIERLYTDFFVPEVLEIKAVTPKLIEKGLVSPVDSRSKLQSEGLPTIAEGLTSLEDNGLTSLVQESFLKKPPGGSPMSVIVNISNFFVDSHEKDKKQLTKEGFILLVLLHSGSIQLEIIMENNVVSLKDIFDKWGILEGVRDKVKITFGKLETPFSPKRFPVLGDITMLKGAMLKKNFDQLSAKRAIDAST